MVALMAASAMSPLAQALPRHEARHREPQEPAFASNSTAAAAFTFAIH